MISPKSGRHTEIVTKASHLSSAAAAQDQYSRIQQQRKKGPPLLYVDKYFDFIIGLMRRLDIQTFPYLLLFVCASIATERDIYLLYQPQFGLCNQLRGTSLTINHLTFHLFILKYLQYFSFASCHRYIKSVVANPRYTRFF